MKRIIFTDDDPAIQDAAKIMLENAGYEVIVYADGNAILNDDFAVPDLFILDKQLSGVDGMDICRYLKTSERTKHIPIIMLSAGI